VAFSALSRPFQAARPRPVRAAKLIDLYAETKDGRRRSLRRRFAGAIHMQGRETENINLFVSMKATNRPLKR
jgi:hypothetical protein